MAASAVAGSHAPATTSRQLSTLEIMSCSGGGAATAVLFTNPLEVVKTRLQMQNELVRSATKVYSGMADCLTKTFRIEGLGGVQRGLQIAVVRDGSKCFFRIGLHEPVLRVLHPGDPADAPGSGSRSAPLWKSFVAGCVSGAVSAVVCNPLDMVKIRVQSAGGLSASHHDIAGLSSPQVFANVVREEGFLALWTGVRVNVARSVAFTSSMMAVNSHVKQALAGAGVAAGPARDAAGSLLGSVVGVMCMNPVDVVRTRLYNQPAGAGLYGSSALRAAKQIAAAEGVTAFWKGAVAHYCRVGPHTVLTFFFIGHYQRLLVDREKAS